MEVRVSSKSSYVGTRHRCDHGCKHRRNSSAKECLGQCNSGDKIFCLTTDSKPAARRSLFKVVEHSCLNHWLDLCCSTCKIWCCLLGLKESGLKEILMAAGKKSKLLYINGMELAALRAEGSDILDLSGWVIIHVWVTFYFHPRNFFHFGIIY